MTLDQIDIFVKSLEGSSKDPGMVKTNVQKSDIRKRCKELKGSIAKNSEHDPTRAKTMTQTLDGIIKSVEPMHQRRPSIVSGTAANEPSIGGNPRRSPL